MIKEILQRQRNFFNKQQTKDVSYRKRALKRLQQEIVKREDDICDALYADFKKPRFETLAAETQFVLAEIKYTLKNVDFWASPERVSSSWMNWPSSDYIYKDPYYPLVITTGR